MPGWRQFIITTLIGGSFGFGCTHSSEPAVKATEPKSLQTVPSRFWSPQEREMAAGHYFLLGQYLALKGSLESSESLLKKAYALDPNSYVGGKLLASSAAIGKNQNLLIDARRMVLLYPKSANLRYLHGQLLAAHGKFAEANREVEKAVALDPEVLEPYLFLIDRYQRQKNLSAAIDLAKKMTQTLTLQISADRFVLFDPNKLQT